jgi:hypothetical protein
MGGKWKRSDAGASYIGRGGSRRTVPHSFIATIGGKRSIYKRKSKKDPRQSRSTGNEIPHGFPVLLLRGPSVPSVFAGDAVQIPLKQYIRERLPQEFARAYRHA